MFEEIVQRKGTKYFCWIFGCLEPEKNEINHSGLGFLTEHLFMREGILPFSIFYKMSQIIVISLFYNYSKVLSPLCLYLKSVKLRPELLLKNLWRTCRSADKEHEPWIPSIIFIDSENLVFKGLPLVKQQNYIGTLLKQSSLHLGFRCLRALTSHIRQGGLR